MSAERLLKLIRTLQSRGKLTTKQLAEITQVSQRTILRDMDTLTLAGIPVVSERGKYGGWRLMEHFQEELGNLQLDVLKALFILPSESILRALNIDESSDTIRQSLISRLPDRARKDAWQYFSKIHIDTTSWRATSSTDSNLIKQLQAALWEDKKLKIVYSKAGGECTERTICPLGLVAKGNSWYVVAMNEQEHYRSFKVSRIAHIEQLQITFNRPPTFQLSQYWEESKSKFIETLPIIEATVLAHHSILPRLSFRHQFVNKIEINRIELNKIEMAELLDNFDSSNDSMLPVVLQFNSEQEIVEYVLGFGEKMKLLQPEHLITQIVASANSVIKLYMGDI